MDATRKISDKLEAILGNTRIKNLFYSQIMHDTKANRRQNKICQGNTNKVRFDLEMELAQVIASECKSMVVKSQ